MAHTTAPPDTLRLRNSFLAVQMRLAALQGRHAELSAQQKALTHQISLAKARVELAPLVTDTFNYLQEKAHARAVGEFEDLLSAFVADVIPEAGAIRLELGTERGAPSLEISLENQGESEEILDGNGGGLTNVVVAALTYAALARTSNRAFVVFDEPDCWLKGTRVPNFTKVIAQVANPDVLPTGEQVGGIQTLMISHNDITLLDSQAHVITLESDDGVPVAVSTSGVREWADDHQEGLRWIEVENLRRHFKTKVKLSPGLNVLAGDINLGKSTLFVTALRAIAYGEVTDKFIRHGADSAIVRVGLEDQVVLEVERYRKTAGFKTIYRKYQAGILVNEGPMDGRSAPSFITDTLRITRVDELDIQLRGQKQPIFLLNETASRRARLLSVGKESSLLQSLIEKHRLELKRDKDSIKRDEATLSATNKNLRGLALLGELNSMVPLLTEMLEDLHEGQKAHAELAQTVEKLKPLKTLHDMASQALPTLATTDVSAPAIADTKQLARLVHVLKTTSAKAHMPEMPKAPEVPTMCDVSRLQGVINQLTANKMLAHLPELPQAPVAPTLGATTKLTQQLAAMTRGARAQEMLTQTLQQPVPTIPVMGDTGRVTELLRKLNSGQALAQVLNYLPDVPGLGSVRDTTSLRKNVHNMSGYQKTIQTLSTAEAAANSQELSAQQALHDFQHTLGVCPVCNSNFKENG